MKNKIELIGYLEGIIREIRIVNQQIDTIIVDWEERSISPSTSNLVYSELVPIIKIKYIQNNG